MLRTTCFSSRWWGLSLFPFSVLIGRDDTRTPEQSDLNRRQRRIQMMEDGDEEKKRSNSKKGLIEAWGCWTEPWITNGCLHSLLPACRNESQPPLSAGTQSPVSSLKQKKDWEEKKKAIIKRERTRQREEERGGGDNEARRRRGRCVWNTRARSSHRMFFLSLSHSGGWIVTPVRVRNSIRRHTASGSPGGEQVLLLLLCDAATCWSTHATTQLLSLSLCVFFSLQRAATTPSNTWSMSKQSHTHRWASYLRRSPFVFNSMLLPENTEVEEEVQRFEVKTAKLQFKTLFSNNKQWNKRQTKNNFQELYVNISISWYFILPLFYLFDIFSH